MGVAARTLLLLSGLKIVNTLCKLWSEKHGRFTLGKVRSLRTTFLQGANSMTSAKYIGRDVHKETISIAVMNSMGKLLMESIIETKAGTILQFFAGLRGDLHVTCEEGTWAAWLYDLLKAHVTEMIVCNPRKNALLKDRNKSDRIDARKLAELLRLNYLKPVYHGEHGLRMLKELSRTYLAISKDLVRVMNRLKALYRGWGIACSGRSVYAASYREAWLKKIIEPGVRLRAEYFYQQLDTLLRLRREVRRNLLIESRKHSATKMLSQIPTIGPIRSAHLVALIQTPHRFRTKRQLWAYSGLAVETHDSAQFRYVDGQLFRSRKPQQLRGLNEDHNHDLKNIFKGAAQKATVGAGPFREFYERLLAKGIKPSMARLTVARKIAAITLAVWKKGVRFDPEQLKLQAA